MPKNEPERLEALRRYDILDTPTETEFDEITKLVAHLCDAPVAVINLVDKERQWFKSEVGLGVRETPIETSFCAHALLEPGLLVVPNMKDDARFEGNPLVTDDPGFQFYAGALLETPDGYPIGTLCVLDTETRELSDHQLTALRILAKHVMNMLELRRTMDERTELAVQLEDSLETLRRMHAMVSHDLRTPLSAVDLSSEQLRRLTDNDRVLEVADRLSRATESMTELLDDLAASKDLQADGPSLEPSYCRAENVVENTIDLLASKAEGSGVEIQTEIEADLPRLYCDPRRTSQVLTNVVGNAVKFSSSGDTVRITVEEREGEVCFAVIDSGPGIAADEIDQVFQPLWRSPSVDREGTGMGLAIARRFTERQDGRIGVESERGRGTTFWFTLPTSETGPIDRTSEITTGCSASDEL